MAQITRQDIVKTAFRVWGRELYLTTSLADLAEELGVSKAALYRHFRNKEALLDAMGENFFDEYAAFVRDGYERALESPDYTERLLIMARANAEYYARNMGAFVFSLIRVYGSREMGKTAEGLRRRGIDLERFLHDDKSKRNYPPMVQITTATLIFWVAVFHKQRKAGDCRLKREDFADGTLMDGSPAEEEIRAMIGAVEGIILTGLGFNKNRVDAMDYGELEKKIPRDRLSTFEDDDLLKAVGETVAKAGPWKASLDMIARRSGLSKSGLYAHFRNKQDMLRQFFMTEFDRMIRYAGAGIARSTVPEEQFYLAVVSLADYFRSRSEILLAADWLKTRRIDLGIEIPSGIYQIFSDIGVPGPDGSSAQALPGGDKDAAAIRAERISQWILFLIINTLMRRPEGMNFTEIPNDSMRRLFRFICLGIKGFET
jgi:AcrR family transcriptional regulator